MKYSSLGYQERRYRVVFDGFLAIFGVFGSAVSLRQGLSDKLLGLAIAKSIVELQGRTSGLKHE